MKLQDAKRGFVLLLRRLRGGALVCLATRFRRLIEDYEGYASTLAGLHLALVATGRRDARPPIVPEAT